MRVAKRIVTFLSIVFLVHPSFAQKEKEQKEKKDIPQVISKKSNKEFILKGVVIDKQTKEPLIGVNIFVEGDKLKGTVTDFNGAYELKVNDSDEVIFRYVGYQDQKVVATGNQTLDIQLGTEETELTTVVVSASRKKEKILDAPASIISVDAATIANHAALGITDHLKNLAGVQVQRTGVQGGQPSVRGFNGYFTSDVMSLTDNRVSKLPNTGLNMYSMMTTTDEDIERIEVLKGPAAALYGPNANNGVIHIITKSPLDHQEIKFWTATGARVRIKDTLVDINRDNPRFDYTNLKDRILFSAGFYIADTIHVKNPDLQIGIKVSSKIFVGHDWRYSDLGDPSQVIKFSASSDTIYYERPDETNDPKGVGVAVKNERDERILNGQVDGRMDFRIKQDFNIVVAGGVNVSNGIIPSPIGAMQNKDWTYSWAQLRFMWKNLFVQAYVNGNNSHNTFFIPVGGRYIDQSHMYSFQVQHSYEIKRRVVLVYGFDAFFTRPETKGTLNGKYEDKDNIDEYGIYLQGEYKLHPRFSMVVATRLDYNTAVKKVLISPKIALVYKPGTGHNIRFTFNRAFKNPASAAYYVDVVQGRIPLGIEVRNEGTPRDGFHYSFNANQNYGGQVLPQFLSPYGTTGQFHDVGDPAFTQVGWQGILSAIRSQFGVQANIDATSPLLPIINQVVNAIIPQTIPGTIKQVVSNLNTGQQKFEPNNDNWKNTENIKGLVPTTTYTYELGYKGVVGKILGVQIDLYRTDFKNYLAPVQLLTPAVMLDADALMNFLAPQITNNYNTLTVKDIINTIPSPLGDIKISELLNLFIDKKGGQFGGNGDGNGAPEFVSLIRKAVENLPVGVITPKEAGGPNLLLVTRNIGNLTLYGIDFNSNIYLPKGFTVSVNYSFVDKDSVKVESAPMGYIALNSPKHKVNIGLNYNAEKLGLNVGVRFNWSAGYPVLSGNFIGEVKPTNDMDLDISYTPKIFNDHYNVTVSFSNIYNKKQQYFVGSPVMGMMGIVKMTYSL